jgi:hypothetical protein
MKIINASMDLTKIDKSKINKHANGAKYYNITIYLNDEPNKFGQNVSIATSISKEEREAGVKQTYIGNGKVVMDKPASGEPKPQAPESFKPLGDFNDLPF